MSRVFVVQEPLKMEAGVPVPRINLGTLKPYGDVEFLFQWSDFKEDDAFEDTDAIVRQLREKLHDFCDDDYIVPLGNPAMIGLAIAVASDCNDGRARVLDWMRERGRYRLINIDIDCAP
jgi:hypothetical protein